MRDRHVRLYLVGVVNERADKAEQHEEHDDRDPDDRQPVFHEHADGGLEQVQALFARGFLARATSTAGASSKGTRRRSSVYPPRRSLSGHAGSRVAHPGSATA